MHLSLSYEKKNLKHVEIAMVSVSHLAPIILILSGYNSLVSSVSHFSYEPLIKCKIIRKWNMIFLFWDYQRKARLYL